ncbi:hypothetical protein [Streptomyces sp. NPDC007991]|uniref:hypothetical protein n=1 Tax=Streptomyces sp. NPDC007991 TaxID=3364803 RepID=UPI0036EBDF9C
MRLLGGCGGGLLLQADEEPADVGDAEGLKPLGAEQSHGRGLGMVSAIAHRIVVHDGDQGHTVTAERYADALRGGHLC